MTSSYGEEKRNYLQYIELRLWHETCVMVDVMKGRKTIRSMEEIHVRIVTGCRDRIVDELLANPPRERSDIGLFEVRLYLSTAVESDLRLCLFWDRELPANGSLLGKRITNGMKAVGLVKHTCWRELDPEGQKPTKLGG